jgi:hypothetical protein
LVKLAKHSGFIENSPQRTGAKGKENKKMALTRKSLKSTGIEAHTETASGLKERDEAREPPNIPEKGQCGRLQFRR